MKSLVPNEVKTLFEDLSFISKVKLCFDNLDVRNQDYISTLNEEDLIKLFKAYIAFNYNLIDTDDEKMAYLHAVKREVILLSITEGFMKLFIKASQSDRELVENIGKDHMRLSTIKKYKNNEFINLLSKYNKRILEIIKDEETITFNQHRINLEEFISVVKCLIIEEMVKNDDPYDIIKNIDSDEIILEEFVLNAFSIYLNGIKGLDERKVERTFELSKLSKIITIAKSDGYLR